LPPKIAGGGKDCQSETLHLTKDCMNSFNGLGMHLGNLARTSNAVTRSISAENFTGAKGQAGMAEQGLGAEAASELGTQGWKVSPCIAIKPNGTFVLADIKGPGAIQHIWITVRPRFWRYLVLRFYWDHEEFPSVEVPLGDFFCNGWCIPCNVNSIPISVNPSGGMNSYWEMPFRRNCRITVENLIPEDVGVFYQIDYTLTEIPEDYAYFHAQWRRSNPLPYQTVHTVLDNVQGHGQFVGTYMAWGANNSGWWGEGEIKVYLDGDSDFPTICGTGTEDYFGGAWCFANPDSEGGYGRYSTPFLGMPQVIEPKGHANNQQRFGLYRWHVQDPIRFAQDLRITIQALGWRPTLGGKRRYLPLQDDIASTAFWYQVEPHVTFPALGSLNALEVI
jgi:hypothetical protein